MDYSARIYRAFTATHNKVDIYSWSNEFCSLFPNTNYNNKTTGRVVPFSTALIQIDENDYSSAIYMVCFDVDAVADRRAIVFVDVIRDEFPEHIA